MALKLDISKIDRERKRMGMKKQDLAKRIGVSNGMITQIYKRRPIKYADKFAKIFLFDPKDLII